MAALARILLQVRPLDADADGPLPAPHDGIPGDLQPAVLHHGHGALGDLVALGQVRIEVLLPVEGAPGLDLAVEPQSQRDGHLHGRVVDRGQGARKAQADRAGPAVGGPAVAVLAGAEHLGPGEQLDMHLQPDDRFVCPLIHLGPPGTILLAQAEAAENLVQGRLRPVLAREPRQQAPEALERRGRQLGRGRDPPAGRAGPSGAPAHPGGAAAARWPGRPDRPPAPGCPGTVPSGDPRGRPGRRWRRKSAAPPQGPGPPGSGR